MGVFLTEIKKENITMYGVTIAELIEKMDLKLTPELDSEKIIVSPPGCQPSGASAHRILRAF